MGSKFFPLRVDSHCELIRQEKIKMAELFPMNVFYITLHSTLQSYHISLVIRQFFPSKTITKI